ncbi:MAG: hypothetical protein WC314_25505 [Vulcanimicrobiota bacterium]
MASEVDTLVSDYNRKFVSGNFEFRLGDQLSKKIAGNGVVKAPGVYVVYEIAREAVLYIGSSGTLRHEGWGKQNLRERLRKKQDGVGRQRFYEEKLKMEGLEAIRIVWWATHDETNRILPAKAEMDLLQAYYDEFGTIPPWNKKA